MSFIIHKQKITQHSVGQFFTFRYRKITAAYFITTSYYKLKGLKRHLKVEVDMHKGLLLYLSYV